MPCLIQASGIGNDPATVLITPGDLESKLMSGSLQASSGPLFPWKAPRKEIGPAECNGANLERGSVLPLSRVIALAIMRRSASINSERILSEAQHTQC